MFMLEVTSAFEVVPGGPPDVQLVTGGDVGYPGVRVLPTDATKPIGPQNIEVRLPADQGLQWGTATQPVHRLQVPGGEAYPGQLSADGMALTFSDVDLDSPPGLEQAIWVTVSACRDATLGATSLSFTVGKQTSASTTILVTPGTSVAPGEP